MSKFLIPGVLAGLVAITMAVRFIPQPKSTEVAVVDGPTKKLKTAKEKAMFSRARMQYEYDMLKDPVTGKLPVNYRNEELAAARLLPERSRDGQEAIMQTTNTTTNNTYQPAGPTNVGGRTRAVAFDKRFNGTTNQVILAGGVSGGIFRSTDGGANWTRVSPENDVHNVTTIAQDPRPGEQDTWYAAGGEPIGSSAADDLWALYLGFGVWKSTNNGATWTKLPHDDIPGIPGQGDCPGLYLLECFDHPFDIVHKLVVNPANGHLFVASHRRMIRSIDGGATWQIVFNTSGATTMDLGQMDIVITDAGKIYLALNGGNPDGSLRGIWTSNTGNLASWTRIAGGNVLNTDSVANWKGNDYTGNSRRIVMALAPSSQNILYVTYENGQDHSGTPAKNEADLFKYDATANAWTNLSANVPNWDGGDFAGIDPFNTQFGYNLTLAVHPTNPNTVFLGGVNLYRSTSGFTNTTNTAWIGGYVKPNPGFSAAVYGSRGAPSDISKWSHPDIHNIAFDPSSPNRAICANDGGMQITQNITAGVPADEEPVTWTVLSNYQTLQYYKVTIDPGPGRMNFAGGAQDNGTRFRDGFGLLSSPTNNNQYRVLGGDGGTAQLAKFRTVNGNEEQYVFCSVQYGDTRRVNLKAGAIGPFTEITPNGLTPAVTGTDLYGEFVTNFKLDQDNTEDLYYVNFNRLFRTTNASTVTRSNWTELTGVSNKVDPNGTTGGVVPIRALELSRGEYFPTHVLYIGTIGGHVYRLNNPRNAAAGATPVDITPPLIRDKSVIVDIASNPNNDEEIIVVASNYQANGVNIVNIWWTNNAKATTPTWHNAEGNLLQPSIRSCAIVVKKDANNNPVTEYYVGTTVGLYSASNIGPLLQSSGTVTWAREGGNVLNYAVVTSLAYRPQDNTLLVGTHGNGMYFANVGTPDFRPNQNTGINDPVRNDDNFIQSAVPTVVANETIDYRIGNMFTVRRLVVQVFAVNGQLVLRRETGYQNGSLNVQKLAKGPYILTITSNDYKQQFVQKFVKE